MATVLDAMSRWWYWNVKLPLWREWLWLYCVWNVLRRRQTVYKAEFIKGVLVQPDQDSGARISFCTFNGTSPVSAIPRRLINGDWG